jgi:virginiamycin B lyase
VAVMVGVSAAGHVTYFPGLAGATGIAAGSDGALWFINGSNSIGRMTPSGRMTFYKGSGIVDPQQITAGPDGALWFTNFSNDSIGRITT